MLSEIDLAKELLKINGIRLQPEDPFTWASGLRSPIYCDNRIALSYPDLRSKIKHTLSEISKSTWEFDIVAGVATAGIPHGAYVADLLGLPFIYVRSKAKKHGARNQIEGRYQKGQKCLVIEDLISTGGSSIAAVEALREQGMDVVGVAAIFTYQLNQASDNFSPAGCLLITLSAIRCCWVCPLSVMGVISPFSRIPGFAADATSAVSDRITDA